MENYHIGIYCGIEVDGAFWFPSMVGNALLCRENGVIKVKGEFINERYVEVPLYIDVKEYDKKLYFIPLGAKSIAVYDLKKGEFSSLEWKVETNIETLMFSGAYAYKNYLYLFPFLTEAVIRVDLVNGDMREVINLKNATVEYRLNETDGYFHKNSFALSGENLYLPFINSHAVLKFSLETEKYHIFNVGDSGYSAIEKCGEDFILASRIKNEIIIWNPQAGIVRKYSNFPESCTFGSASGMVVYNNVCWIFPDGANMVVKLELDTGNMREEVIFRRICEAKYNKYSMWNGIITFFVAKDKEVLLGTGRTAEMLCFNIADESLESEHWSVPEEWKETYVELLNVRYTKYLAQKREIIKKRKYHEEVEEYGVKEFIEDIMIRADEPMEEKNSGKEIYNCILHF